MISVVCVLRSGGIYTPEWVYRLRAGVEKHLKAKHTFICLSDLELNCHRVRLWRPWYGWWSKIELFRPNLFTGPTLYMDLDTIVTGPLDPLVRKTSGFTMCADFLRPEIHNSSVMSWRGDYSQIHQAFEADPAGAKAFYRLTPDGRIGDQAFIEDVVEQIDTFPGRTVASFKRHARHGVPAGTAAVTFHGKPKPPEAGGWVRNHWPKDFRP
jgi:hypothetical protein